MEEGDTPVVKKKSNNPNWAEDSRKAFLALKAKREKVAEEKARKVAVIKSNIAEIAPAPAPVVEDKPKKERKARETKPKKEYMTKDDLAELRALMTTKPPVAPVVEKEVVVKEIVKEVPVTKEVVVHKERVLSGNELLNRIFFK